MYTGSNPTALISQKMIADSFLKLLEKKPFNKITITEINRKAKLSRQTYYSVFDSKEEILKFNFQCVFNEYKKNISELKIKDLNSLLNITIDIFIDNVDFLSIIVKNNLNDLFVRMNSQFLREMGKYIQVTDEEHKDYALSFITGAFTEMLSHWLEDDKKLSRQDMIDLTEKILSGKYFMMQTAL